MVKGKDQLFSLAYICNPCVFHVDVRCICRSDLPLQGAHTHRESYTHSHTLGHTHRHRETFERYTVSLSKSILQCCCANDECTDWRPEENHHHQSHRTGWAASSLPSSPLRSSLLVSSPLLSSPLYSSPLCCWNGHATRLTPSPWKLHLFSWTWTSIIFKRFVQHTHLLDCPAL